MRVSTTRSVALRTSRSSWRSSRSVTSARNVAAAVGVLVGDLARCGRPRRVSRRRLRPCGRRYRLLSAGRRRPSPTPRYRECGPATCPDWPAPHALGQIGKSARGPHNLATHARSLRAALGRLHRFADKPAGNKLQNRLPASEAPCR
jgi:hypothetical protein